MYESMINEVMSDLISKLKNAKSIIKKEGIGVLLYKTSKLFTEYYLKQIAYRRKFRKYGVKKGVLDYYGKFGSELPIYDHLFENLEKCDVFYDVGASTRSYSTLIPAAVPNGKVVCFQPNKNKFKEIERVSSIFFDNVILVNKAIAYDGTEARPSNILADPNEKYGTNKSITGQEILQSDNIPVPNVIKIDVRESELEVIKSLRPILEHNKCRLLWLETHPPTGTILGDTKFDSVVSPEVMNQFLAEEYSYDEILRILSSSGFDWEFDFVTQKNAIYIKAYKTDPVESPGRYLIYR